jgi:hypothetical protein
MLDGEKRRRVAEACISGMPGHQWEVTGVGRFIGIRLGSDNGIWFDPGKVNSQWKALVRTCAELIEATIPQECELGSSVQVKYFGYLIRLNEALATSNVDAIEQLVSELIGEKRE